MNIQAAVALLSALIATTGLVPSVAQAAPSASFVSADDYAAVDANRVWKDVNAALSRDDPESVFLPAARLGPAPVAMLALDASEPALERVRYRLRYGTDWIDASPGGALQAVSYVEVVRFNLGPAIRQGLVESTGGDAVADAGAFGVGPHVGWRLVTQPLMGNRAIVVAAGRMEMDEEAARAETCLGVPCLDATPAIEAVVAWSDMEPADAGSAVQPADVGEGLMSPTVLVDLLLGEVDGIETEMAAGEPAVPDWTIEAVIEVNLGQDVGLDAAYRRDGLLDDSVAAIWQRLAAVGAGSSEPTVFRASAYECARGPDFAPPGDYCP